MNFLRSKFNARFFLYLGLAIILIQCPSIGNYVRGLNTLIHESAHAFIALLNGHLEKITLLPDSEGVTTGTSAGWVEGIFTSTVGYTFSSFIGFLSFWLIKKKKFTILIDILLSILFVSLILWVRNPYGVFWIISFTFGFLIIIIKAKKTFIRHFLTILASIILVDSLISAYEILLLSIFQPLAAGDAANLAFLTMFLPTQFWGSFFFMQAIGFAIFGFSKGLYRLDGLDKENKPESYSY